MKSISLTSEESAETQRAQGGAHQGGFVPRPLTSVRWILIVGVTCLFAFSAVYWIGVFRTTKMRGLVVRDEGRNFGEVWAQSAFQWTVPIHNSAKNRIEVTDVKSSCSCTSVSPRSFFIPPGETRIVTLTLNLLPGNPQDAEKEVREFRVLLYPRLSQPSEPLLEWAVSGSVRTAFRVSAQVVRFTGSDRIVSGVPAPPKVVTATSYGDLQSLNAKCDSDQGTVRVKKLAVEPAKFQVAIAPNNALPVGPFRFNVILQGVLKDGRRLPPYPIAVTGIVEPEITSLPASVDFGVCRIPSEARATLTLAGHRGERFSIEKVTFVGMEATVAIRSRGLRSRHALDIVAKVRRSGESRGRLDILTRTQAGQERNLTIPILAYGTPTPGR